MVKFKFEETDKISPPLLQLSEVSFGYDPAKPIISHANVDVSLDSRVALIGPNGAGVWNHRVWPRLTLQANRRCSSS